MIAANNSLTFESIINTLTSKYVVVRVEVITETKLWRWNQEVFWICWLIKTQQTKFVVQNEMFTS